MKTNAVAFPRSSASRPAKVRAMSRAEEAALLRLAKAGDHEAQTRLLRQFDRLVYQLSCYYATKRVGTDVEDLAQAGRMGLLYAMRKYDEKRINPATRLSYRFITIASHWVRNYVQKEDSGGPIYVPCSAYKRPAVEAQSIAAKNTLSLDSPDQFGEAAEWPDPHAEDLLAVNRVEYDDAIDFGRLIRRLKDRRQRRVIQGRFFEGKMLHEIGAELGVSKERIRQLEATALASLRRLFGTRRRKANRPTLLPR
jgi:RNA polymerase sigma factor (sigma-70 family)